MIKTQMINPIKKISELFKIDGYEGELVLSHIHYDPKLNNDYDYQVIKQSTHDGTLFFTMDIIGEALERLVNKITYCSKDLNDEEVKNLKDIEYTIGDIRLESDYDEVSKNKVTDTVYIPVRCKYTFKEI